jgi:hypothetical protein
MPAILAVRQIASREAVPFMIATAAHPSPFPERMMTDSPDQFDRGPLELSPEERRQLAQAFSLPVDQEPDAAADDRSWKEELLRRVTGIRNGTAETAGAEPVFAGAGERFADAGAPSADADVPEDVEAAWAEQMRLRLDDFMAGRTPSSSAEEVLARLRASRRGSE